MENMPKILCPHCDRNLSFKIIFENIYGKVKLTSRENTINIGLSGLVMQNSKIIPTSLFCKYCNKDIETSKIIIFNAKNKTSESAIDDYMVLKVSKEGNRAQYLLYNKHDEKLEKLLHDYKVYEYSVEQLPLLLNVQG
jgi:hypothetical protein